MFYYTDLYVVIFLISAWNGEFDFNFHKLQMCIMIVYLDYVSCDVLVETTWSTKTLILFDMQLLLILGKVIL